jgi:membrane-associated phospholipid phosphatase
MTALASRTPTTPSPPPAPARGAGHVLAPLAVAILAAAGVAAVWYVFIRTSLGQSVDTTAMRGGDVHHPRVVEVLSRTLNGTTLVSLVLVCLVAATIGVLRKRLDLAIAATVLVIGANASCQLLKTHLTRANLDDFPAPNSFPSGHTAAAASVAFALILVLPHAVRGLVALIGAGYVAVIAVATVWAEWHRPSDTVGALLLVLAWSALAAFGVRLRRLRSPAPADGHSRPTLWLLLIGGAIAGVAALVGLTAVVMSERVTPDLVSGRFAFLAGSAGVAAAVCAAFLIWVRLAAGDRATVENEPATAVRPARRSKGGNK